MAKGMQSLYVPAKAQELTFQGWKSINIDGHDFLSACIPATDAERQVCRAI